VATPPWIFSGFKAFQGYEQLPSQHVTGRTGHVVLSKTAQPCNATDRVERSGFHAFFMQNH
jgi:hypothetical protein